MTDATWPGAEPSGLVPVNGVVSGNGRTDDGARYCDAVNGAVNGAVNDLGGHPRAGRPGF